MTPLVTMADPGSAAAEAFRGLRTNLLVAAGDEARAWLITSAAPGESKSDVAGNLAVVCAEAGRRVVLVDADLRTPRQHEMFSLATDTGLSTVLGGALDDLPLQATSVAGLDVLPAGPPAGRPADLVSSPRMADVVATLKERADLVLVDAPAVLSASDAPAVAAVVDAVVLVLAAGRSRRADAALAREALDRVGAEVLGVVLTGVSPRQAGYGYFARDAGGS